MRNEMKLCKTMLTMAAVAAACAASSSADSPPLDELIEKAQQGGKEVIGHVARA
jgi:hypothetical protein